ncbi:hypothetical protein [Pedobacter alpinus]|uniref:Uncharacterized protein n=1 Tax=Pedobacter alpinus TaxID=1590643 RepID=A0ABW5TSZ8_9SPHI
MKFKLTLVLVIIFAIPTFAQLNKATLESKFPLLTLPYELPAEKIPMYEPTDGKMNPKKHIFLKDDVTELVFGAMVDEKTIKKSIKTPNSKINAIGRFTVGKLNFIVYNINDYRSDAYINVVYVASLSTDYKIVDISNIVFFAIFNNADNSSRTTQIIRKASLSNNKLLLSETSRAIKNIDVNGKESINTQKSNNAYIFNEAGVIENLMIISK